MITFHGGNWQPKHLAKLIAILLTGSDWIKDHGTKNYRSRFQLGHSNNWFLGHGDRMGMYQLYCRCEGTLKYSDDLRRMIIAVCGLEHYNEQP